MKVTMTPWHVIVDDMTYGGRSRTVDMMRYAYNVGFSDGALWGGLAQFFMLCEPTQSMLHQKYVLEFYRNNKEYQALIARAEDALFFPGLRFYALNDLLSTAVHLQSVELVQEYAAWVCDFHRQKLLLPAQVLTIFFNAVMPYYHRKMHSESILAARQVLQHYHPEMSQLLYAHMQAKLHAYTTAIAEELIGERDPLFGG